MKYAIYDKAADAYLTKMIFDMGYSENTKFECEITAYITKAHLLDTKKDATDAVTRIKRFEFMGQPGRFVIHSFDDTLNDQYIISEAGNPTKVVDNITVDLSGTINVKYGTMISHWSTISLNDTIDRMNALQKAVSAIYTSWNNTFDIYKVINIMDEKEHTHYQFINVTAEGLEKYSTDPLNKRIEELEKANYELGERVAERGIVANRLLDENNSLKTKVESIKKETRNWKTLYENASDEREELKNIIDIIRTDLASSTACDNLKDTLKAINGNSGLDNISMENFLTAKDEIRSIISHVITILESRELNQSVAFSSAEEVDRAKKLANDIIDICEAQNDKFEVTLKKFSQLYEAVNDPGDDDDTIMYAFKGVLEIFSSLEDHVRNIIDESVTWEHKAMKAEKALDDQKKLNELFNTTIARYRNERRDMDKELSDLKRRAEEAIVARDCSAEIIHAIRNAIVDGNADAFDCIESRMRHDSDFNSDPFMAGVRENVKDICTAEKKNIANHELKNSEIAKAADALKEVNDKNEGLTNMLKEITDCIADIMIATKTVDRDEMISKLINISSKIGFKTRDDGPIFGILFILNTLIRILKDGAYFERHLEEAKNVVTVITKERDKALERAEFYKRQANSVYGMTIPGRCCSKQLTADILSGKKIPISKKKYDDLVEYVANVNLTYDNMFCMMDKPVYLSTITESLNDLTK